MDLETAIANFEIVRNVKEYQKFRVVDKNMRIDDRYFPSVQRTWTGEHREQLTPIFQETLEIILRERALPLLTVLNVLRGFNAKMELTYPDFPELHAMIRQYITHVNTLWQGSENNPNKEEPSEDVYMPPEPGFFRKVWTSLTVFFRSVRVWIRDTWYGRLDEVTDSNSV